METHKAFAKTVEVFNISLSELSEKSWIAQSSISRFKNGRADMGSFNLSKLLKAMPSYAQYYFFALWIDNNYSIDQAAA